MFSRSDKADETGEVAPIDGVEGQRNPMVLAVIAGLLAVVGAFLLVRYLSDNSADSAGVAEAEETRLVLVVTQPIPQGTEVNTILASPATYLASRDAPAQYVASSALSTVQELREYEGFTLASDIFEGQQLLREQFLDPSDFSGESFLSQVAAVEPPPGHHTVVLPLAASSALGGNVRPGDSVAVTATFRVTPSSQSEQDPYDIALVVLPTVEVVNVETSAEFIGEVSASTSDLGTATVGDFVITIAVEPGELADLVYTMRYGDIVLATALEDADDRDDREFAVFATMLSGADFFADNSGVDFILGNLVDPEELATTLGVGEDGPALQELEDALTDPSGEGALADTDDAEGESLEASPASVELEEVPAEQTDPAVPPASDSDEPEPAGPGETVDQQAPIDDANGDGALPPGN